MVSSVANLNIVRRGLPIRRPIAHSNIVSDAPCVAEVSSAFLKHICFITILRGSDLSAGHGVHPGMRLQPLSRKKQQPRQER